MDVKPKEIRFENHLDFTPNLTPSQIFALGSFIDQGGYWRPIFSTVVNQNLENCHLEFENFLFQNIDQSLLINDDKNTKLNKYGVKCGSSLCEWEKSNWISKHDPYGWVQWYCRFYCREFYPSYRDTILITDEMKLEDYRQIKRWKNFAGNNGRWKRYLLNLIVIKKTTFDDFNVSPVTRQNLQHWGYQITQNDLEEFIIQQNLAQN